MHTPQQTPPGFIDRTCVAQVDCLFQSRGTQVRRLPAVFERSYTCAAQFPGKLESQMGSRGVGARDSGAGSRFFFLRDVLQGRPSNSPEKLPELPIVPAGGLA